MRMALALARRAQDEGEVPVGCVVVCDGAVVGRGWNRREQTQNALEHAEMMALDEACRALDVPRPIWLPKNEREFSSFRMTAFTQDHFVEEIHFERMEIEFIDDVRRKSKDPRNDFGF